MRAALLKKISTIEIEERNPPSLQKDKVLVRIRAVGICRSDVHYFLRGSIGPTSAKFPFVIGHECAGMVEEVGESVTGFKPGDRVAVEPAQSCGVCESCRKGRPNICPNVLFLGTPPTEGALQELLSLSPSSLFPLPSTLSFEEGVMSEPLAVSIHTLNLAANARGCTAAVIGAGPIGLTTLRMALLRGAAEILAVDPLAYRREIAVKWGSKQAIDPLAQDPAQAVLKATQGRGVDLVFEAAGTEEAVSQAVQMAAPGGKVLLAGIPESMEVSYDPHVFRRREITMQAVRRSNECTEEALRLIEDASVQCNELVTHTFPLQQAEEAFRIAADYRDGIVKGVILL